MRELILILVITLSFNFINILKAQNCVHDFVEVVLKASQSNNDKFCKKVRTVLKDHSKDYKNLLEYTEILNIPMIFATKEGSRLCSKGIIDKSDFVCYLDANNLVFDEALLTHDSLVLGAVLQSPNPTINLEFINDIDSYRVKLAKAIMKINPEIIFRIYNIPRCFWYIKDNRLFVLSYEHLTSEIKDFQVHDAYSYIRDYLKEEEICFLYHKRVIVISGR